MVVLTNSWMAELLVASQEWLACMELVLISPLRYRQQEFLGRTNRLLSLIPHGPHWKNASNNSYIVACEFITAVTFLPSCFLAMIKGCLPSRCLVTMGNTHIDTQTDGRDSLIGYWDGLRCHDIRTKFRKDWFRHSKVNWVGGGGYTHTHTDRTAYFIFSK
jgi:hypothetical protein